MKANNPEEKIDPVTFRNEFLGVWVAKITGMEMEQAAAYMQTFMEQAENCDSKENLARFIGNELDMYNCRADIPLIKGMINHYEKKVGEIDLPGHG